MNDNALSTAAATTVGLGISALAWRELAYEGGKLGLSIAFPQIAVPLRVLQVANVVVWSALAIKNREGIVSYVSSAMRYVSAQPDLDEARNEPWVLPTSENPVPERKEIRPLSIALGPAGFESSRYRPITMLTTPDIQTPPVSLITHAEKIEIPLADGTGTFLIEDAKSAGKGKVVSLVRPGKPTLILGEVLGDVFHASSDTAPEGNESLLTELLLSMRAKRLRVHFLYLRMTTMKMAQLVSFIDESLVPAGIATDAATLAKLLDIETGSGKSLIVDVSNLVTRLAIGQAAADANFHNPTLRVNQTTVSPAPGRAVASKKDADTWSFSLFFRPGAIN